MRKLFKLVVFLLVAHAFYQFAPLYWKDARLNWDAKEAAINWRDLNQTQIEDEILALAASIGVPISRESLNVRSTGARVTVDVAYRVPVHIVPGWKYRWPFGSTIETWTLNRTVRAP